ALEKAFFLAAARRCDHLVAELREYGDGNAANPTGSACHEHGPAVWCHGMVLERHNGQHRRVARCPDSHGLSRREHRGSLDQPVAVDASVLGIATIMRLAGAPTIQDNVISRLELGM